MPGSLPKIVGLIACSATVCSAQSNPRFGVGARASTLGWGVEGAVAVTEKSNVRAGLNFVGFGRTFNRDGIDYNGQLKMRSIETHYDWFLFRGFRVSPGLLVYNGNHIVGSVSVPGGRQFTIGGNTYYSNPSDKVNGPFRMDFAKPKLSPILTVGAGNLVRREGSRFTVTAEVGVVFQDSPHARLDLQGSVGLTPAGPFFNVASNPQVQADLRAEETKINAGTPPYDTLRTLLKTFPVISGGIGFRIK